MYTQAGRAGLLRPLQAVFRCQKSMLFRLHGNSWIIQSKSKLIGRITHRTEHNFSPSNNAIVTVSSKTIEMSHGGDIRKFPFVWLRDHCQCLACINLQTCQRRISGVMAILKSAETLRDSIVDGRNLHLTWGDNHQSVFPIQWLFENYYPKGQAATVRKQPWGAAFWEESNFPQVTYQEHVTSEDGLKCTLHNLIKYGFSIVTQTPADSEHTQKVAERICFIQETMFGKMWAFSANLEWADTAYTREALGAHTDNTYFTCPAGVQVFHCLEHEGSGGETLLVDGFKAASEIKRNNQDFIEVLSSVVIPHQYKDQKVHLRSLGPVLTYNPATSELLQIRYNPYDRGPLSTLLPDRILHFYKAYAALEKEITSPRNEFWIKLLPGMVLLVDNWRVLHGRAAFTGHRVLCGCYLPRDDWISSARVAGYT